MLLLILNEPFNLSQGQHTLNEDTEETARIAAIFNLAIYRFHNNKLIKEDTAIKTTSNLMNLIYI